MNIFRKYFDDDEFNCLEIDLTFPVIKNNNKYNPITGDTRSIKVSFETCIYYRREDEYAWYFTIRILGFGFVILRQFSY